MRVCGGGGGGEGATVASNRFFMKGVGFTLSLSFFFSFVRFTLFKVFGI